MWDSDFKKFVWCPPEQLSLLFELGIIVVWVVLLEVTDTEITSFCPEGL